MNKRNKLKSLLLGVLVIQLFFAYLNPVFAQTAQTGTQPLGGGAESSIRDLLCTPSSNNPLGSGENTGGDDLYNCINRLYKFAIAFSSIAAVFMITIAGYLYMSSDGSEESVTKAKEMLVSSITALVILFITFVLLREINPELVKFKVIQPGVVTGGVPGSTGAGSQYAGGGGSCVATSNNLCSIGSLQSACSWDPQEASKVCNLESGGGRNARVCSGVDICTTTGRPGGPPKKMSNGKNMSFSCGLFQINLTNAGSGRSPDMPSVCQNLFTGGNYNCDLPVANEPRYEQCLDWLANTGNTFRKACSLYKASGWKPWINTANKCGVGSN